MAKIITISTFTPFIFMITILVVWAHSPPNVEQHKNINLLPKQCGITKNSDESYQFPWMASLWYTDPKYGLRFRCAGTIINNKYILTAAVCATNGKLSKVRVGNHDLQAANSCTEATEAKTCTPPYKELDVEKSIVHDQSDEKLHQNDIALLRVSQIDFTDKIKPVCLPLEESRNFDLTNKDGILTGWGFPKSGNESRSLLKGEMPIVPFEECQKKYQNIATLIHSQLCAGRAKNNAESNGCIGISGSPLHIQTSLHGDTRFVQQGFVSFGPRNCSGAVDIPDVYTKVASYMDWILDNMEP